MIEHIKKSLQTKLKVVLLLLVTLILYNGWEPRLGIFPPTFYDFAFNYYGFVDILTFLVIIVIAYKNDAFKKIFDIFRPKNLLFILFFIVGGNIFIALAHHLYFQMTPALEAFPEHSIDLANYFARTPFWSHSLDLFVIGPISEELIYREYLYRLFDKKCLACFVSVTVFAWVHTGFTYSFFLYLPISLVVTLAYHRRKAIGESIALHSSINLINTYLPNLLSFWVL